MPVGRIHRPNVTLDPSVRKNINYVKSLVRHYPPLQAELLRFVIAESLSGLPREVGACTEIQRSHGAIGFNMA